MIAAMDRRTIVLVGAFASSAACEQATPPASQASAPTTDTKGNPDTAPTKVDAPPAEAPIVGDAVVRSGAKLFFAPTGDLGLELPKLVAATGIAVRVVGEEGGRFAVETLVGEPAEHHCAATAPGLSDFRLRFFVTKDALSRVLTAEHEHAFADGTKIRLAPGIAVPEGTTELFARGVPVHVPLPAEKIGRSYKPGQAFAAEGQGSLAELPGHPLMYDGRELPEDALYRESGTVRFALTERADDALVTVRNACMEATVKLTAERLATPAREKSGLYRMKGPADAIPEIARNFDPDMAKHEAGILGVIEEKSSAGAFAMRDSDEDVWGGLTGTEIGEAYGVAGLGLVGTGRGVAYQAKNGASISWSDGRPAGQVTREHAFASAPRDEGGRKCFDAPVTGDDAAALALCFAPGDITEVAGGGEGTIGLGNVGLIGRSSEFGFGRSGRVPSVRQAAAEVTGSLDKDIIRRIVRAHINEVRHCYNQGLVKDPALKGRVAIDFTIGATGSVTASDVGETSVTDENVGNCIAKAVKRWKFPKPDGGGSVNVKYPFVLEPG